MVNSAGHGPRAQIIEITDEQWHTGMDVYLMNVIRSVRLVTPIMQAQKSGAIVNISTAWVAEPSPMFPTSAVFRAGLAAYTKLYADTYAADNIRMNNVLPGHIDSYPHAAEVIETIQKPLATAIQKGAVKLRDVFPTRQDYKDSLTAFPTGFIVGFICGVLPGMGGSQRLTHAIGKSKAMEMCLTGRMMGAEEAERAGLVSRVVPAAELIDEAMKTAQEIASMGRLAVMANKEAVNAAFENTLHQGLQYERRLFNGICASEDKKEGMAAFVEKRPAQWKGR